MVVIKIREHCGFSPSTTSAFKNTATDAELIFVAKSPLFLMLRCRRRCCYGHTKKDRKLKLWLHENVLSS